MKKINTVLFSIICGLGISGYSNDTFALSELGDSNPFMKTQKNSKNNNIEPEGVAIYSFEKNANKVTEIEPDRAYIQEAEFTKKYGFAHVHSSKVRDFSTLISQYKDHDADFRLKLSRNVKSNKSNGAISPMSKAYAFKTADLSRLVQNKGKLVLESPSGNFFPNKGWDSLVRIIQTSSLGNVIVREWDFSLSNGGVIMDKDAINFDINGYPGILIVRESETGKAETVLSWADRKKSYTIELDRNISIENLMGELKGLAESMSEPSYFIK